MLGTEQGRCGVSSTLITKAFPIRGGKEGATVPQEEPRGQFDAGPASRERERTRNQLVTLSGCLIVEFLLQWGVPSTEQGVVSDQKMAPKT